MQIYLDTANVSEIKEYVELGLCDGVTTNPSILAKEGKDIVTAISAIAKVVSGPINVEPIATDFDGIIKEAEEYSKIGNIFFQAEDGIRDWSVTGVQTCALPI